LTSHKVAGVKEAIESVGAEVLYLPPYSPDLNPIENAFSKLKTMLRKLKLRSMPELWKKLGKLCDIFSPDECLTQGTTKNNRPKQFVIRSRENKVTTILQ